MINQSGDFVCFCLFSCLVVLVSQGYKGGASRLLFSLIPLPSLHHYIQTIMSSPAYSSVPFSFKEDACAQDVVESMEQVGDLASSCLKWAYEIFLGG